MIKDELFTVLDVSLSHDLYLLRIHKETLHWDTIQCLEFPSKLSYIMGT